MRVWTLLMGLLVVLASGCAKPFIYEPNGLAVGGPTAPVKVAILPFADGTEDFIERMGPGTEKKFNLAKKGFVDRIGALPPELWSKALADDLAASGRFRSVKLVYATSELTDEEYYVEGTLLKAYIFGHPSPPGEWSLALKARRAKDQRLVWERQVSRNFTEWDMGQLHPWLNQSMREMFAEAGEDLARTLGGRPGSGKDASPTPGEPARTGEPVDETIRRIMEGK